MIMQLVIVNNCHSGCIIRFEERHFNIYMRQKFSKRQNGFYLCADPKKKIWDISDFVSLFYKVFIESYPNHFTILKSYKNSTMQLWMCCIRSVCSSFVRWCVSAAQYSFQSNNTLSLFPKHDYPPFLRSSSFLLSKTERVKLSFQDKLNHLFKNCDSVSFISFFLEWSCSHCFWLTMPYTLFFYVYVFVCAALRDSGEHLGNLTQSSKIV